MAGERVQRYYAPDFGTFERKQYRTKVDQIRGELIFPVFSDEEKAKALVPEVTEWNPSGGLKELDREGTGIIWRKTWKEWEKVAKSENCVGMILDPPESEEGFREKIHYLENPNQAAHHYLNPEMRQGD